MAESVNLFAGELFKTKPNSKNMEQTTGLTFGQALELIKQGHRLQRSGWNGKNMHIYKEDNFHVILGQRGMKHEREYAPVIIMFTADGKHQPGWLASQADMFAEDWQIVQS
jgi:hypothetical protein